MIKQIYKKTIELAGHKSSKFFLAIMSFIESFIFPIPPDVLIIIEVSHEKRVNNILKEYVIEALKDFDKNYLTRQRRLVILVIVEGDFGYVH